MCIRDSVAGELCDQSASGEACFFEEGGLSGECADAGDAPFVLGLRIAEFTRYRPEEAFCGGEPFDRAVLAVEGFASAPLGALVLTGPGLPTSPTALAFDEGAAPGELTGVFDERILWCVPPGYVPIAGTVRAVVVDDFGQEGFIVPMQQVVTPERTVLGRPSEPIETTLTLPE